MTEPLTREFSRRKKEWGRWAAFLAFLLVYAWAYSYLGAVLILEKNTERTGNPQEAFIDAVYESASLSEGRFNTRQSISSEFTRALPQYTNGLIDPLWPWLMRGYSDESPDELFERGKWTNLILSGSLLILMGVMAARAFSFIGAAATILMGGFGVILERSAFFSPDALYYLLIVLAWLCALSLIRRNVLWLYGVFGILLGLAYLAKSLVWPIVAGFLVVSLIRSLAVALTGRRRAESEELWSNANQLVGLAIFVTAFMLVVGPRLSFANAEFGDPFHTYEKYMVWLDSPGEAARFRQNHPGREELSSIPPGQQPGLVKYTRENGVRELFARAWHGAWAQFRASVLGRGGWILMYGFVVFLVTAAFHRWAALRQDEEVWRVRGTSARWMILFLVVVSAITLFHSGIGNEIIPGSSMTTSLFLPILVTFIWIAERYRRQLQRSQHARLVNRVYGLLMILPIVWIGIRIVQAVKAPVT
ncbi:MAG: hypothetical protein WD342_10465 [Verrucomicrobiales bacterium]